MKTEKHTNLILRSSLALALSLAICPPVQSQSEKHMDGKKMVSGAMMEDCRAMMDKKKEMMADMKVQDAELIKQIAKMNRAPDDRKMAMMAQVITTMAEQRAAMNARKAQMEEELMQHMMDHMMMGKESMDHCTMMKGMSKK